MLVLDIKVPDLDPALAPDSIQGALLAQAIAVACNLTTTAVPQAQPGVLDPCTDAPLLSKGGTTIVVAGGDYAQRLSRYLATGLSPVTYTFDDSTSRVSFDRPTILPFGR